jgi:hypothetical protein
MRGVRVGDARFFSVNFRPYVCGVQWTSGVADGIDRLFPIPIPISSGYCRDLKLSEMLLLNRVLRRNALGLRVEGG